MTCVFTNTAKRPSLTIVKNSTLLSDPVNGTTMPKRIPGSVVRYAVTVTNSGNGTVDANTLSIADPIPASTSICVSTLCGNPIVEFLDGSTPSGLGFSYAGSVAYSNAPGGGAPFTYVPVADANGFDPNVTGIRITPTGAMNAAGSGNPAFTVQFRVRIQ